MEQLLYDFLKKYTNFSEKEIQRIAEKMVVVSYKKGDILLEQGKIAKKCYMVLSGCVRQYSINAEGKEVTSNFFTKEQSITIFKSYKQQLPSEHFLVCLEDSTLIVGDVASEELMYQQFPQLQQITRTMIETEFGEVQEENAIFLSLTPEERYQNLKKTRPDLLEKVPQHQLASYLGIAPESLSRIKKRIEEKGRPS